LRLAGKKEAMDKSTQQAFDFVAKLSASGFWGYLTLKYEAGKVVHMRLEENLKPSEVNVLPERTGRKNYESECKQ
jgi:hypothetical protein